MTYVEKLKDKDLKRKDGGKVFLLTGHSRMLQTHHGVVIETEQDYPEITKTPDNGEQKGFYNNYVIIGTGDLYRNYELIDKVRPEGFKTSSTAIQEAHFSDECDLFLEKASSIIKKNKVRRLDIGDGITLVVDEGSLFDLSDPAELKELTSEVVKRLSISEELIRKLSSSGHLIKELFQSIDEQMQELGCKYYTFDRVDGGSILRILEGKRAAEIRAVGYKQK